MNDFTKIVINVPMTKQIGVESWRDGFYTKIFPINSTIKEIMDWAKSMDKTILVSDLYFGFYDE